MLGFDPTLLQRPKRLHADGTVTILCRICERPISREMYKGFSTATCAVCFGELERGKRPDEIMAERAAQERQQANAVYDDIGGQRFRAHGFGQRIKEVIEQVKMKATARRRGPLMSGKDPTPVK